MVEQKKRTGISEVSRQTQLEQWYGRQVAQFELSAGRQARQHIRLFMQPDPTVPPKLQDHMKRREVSIVDSNGQRVGFLSGPWQERGTDIPLFHIHSMYTTASQNPEVKDYIAQYNSDSSGLPVIHGVAAASVAHLASQLNIQIGASQILSPDGEVMFMQTIPAHYSHLVTVTPTTDPGMPILVRPKT